MSCSLVGPAQGTPSALATSFNGTRQGKTALLGGGGDDSAYALVLQPDGKLVAAGATRPGYFALARYNPNGLLDKSFNRTRRVTTKIGSYNVADALVVQPDGKLAAAGFSEVAPPKGHKGDLLVFALARYKPNGLLDRSFNGTGTVTTKIWYDDLAYALALQPDGKLVAAGASLDGFALARYKPNGSLDRSFSGNGKVRTEFGQDDAATAVALQPDGKLVAAGYRQDVNGENNFAFALARYKRKGSLDRAFSRDGKVTTKIGPYDDFAYALAVQPDGKLVAAGYSFNGSNRDFALARYNPNGSLDPSFGRGGVVLTSFPSCPCAARAVALQRNGKILVGGYHDVPGQKRGGFALARYLPNGSLDPKFGNRGVAFTALGKHSGDYSYIAGLALQPNGMIVAAGGSDHQRPSSDTSNLAVARYRRNGSLDRSFGRHGMRETDVPGGSHYNSGTSVALQKDGSIVVVGNSETYQESYDFVLARYRPSGSLDGSFGNGGTVHTDFAGGSDYANGIALQSKGRIVLAGMTRVAGEQTFTVGLAGYVRGPLQCLVPPTRGKRLTVAKRLIREARCSVGSIRRRYSVRVRPGHVISERPRAFEGRPAGARVRLVVSKGKAAR